MKRNGLIARAIERLFFWMIVALPGLAAMSPDAAAADRYDVSYIWSRSLAGVLDYRDRVAKVLGPGVANSLKVVAKDDLFGLVYARHGDRVGVTRVAEAHTGRLQSRGLEAAAPVRSQDWAVRDNGGARQESFAADSVPTRDLQAAVEDHISRLRREGKIKADERTGWSVYDFTTGEKLVSINEDELFQAASMVKPFIAAAFFCKVEQGKLVYGNRSRRHMELMILHSSNAATNWVLRKVGGPKAAERILKRNYPGIFQETRLVEYIPRGGRTYRNKASLHDFSRFLYAIWKEEIAGAREIRRLMALPGPDRIYTGIARFPHGTEVWNKTGSTARVCGDMGILNVKGPDGRHYPYTVIGIIEKGQRARDYASWIRSRSKVIRNVSRTIYKGISKRYDFY